MNNFICPHCKNDLQLINRSLICSRKHCFDLAKEGYVNLLPVQSKKSKDPGDNSKMMMARRSFLESGHYEPLVKRISEIVQEFKKKESVMLDLGCGEGYYTGYIKEKNAEIEMYGLDISKVAIRYASKKHKDISFCVASAFELPFNDNELDLILRIYAPSSESELLRVMKKGAYLITVSPGERHLYQIREFIYKEVYNLSENNKKIENISLIEKINLKYALNIQDSNTVCDLLDMTPFGWKISEDDKSRLLDMGQWDIECDFNIEIYRL